MTHEYHGEEQTRLPGMKPSKTIVNNSQSSVGNSEPRGAAQRRFGNPEHPIG